MEDEAFLGAAQTKVFEGPDRNTYLHIGYFVTWFSAVEVRLTQLLALAVRATNLEGFELLTRGMDARIKLERLRRACRNRGNIGRNLSERLRHFEKRMIPLRNKMAHSFVITDPTYARIHFASVAKLPYAAYGLEQIGENPDSLAIRDVFEHALWLNYFSNDLDKVIRAVQTDASKIFEIDHPLSPSLKI
jgi:hypothetical protein